MTTPTPLREALATALRDGGYVRSVARRYGHFNDVYWDQSADAILVHPSMQAVAEHEAVGRAVARLPKDDDVSLEWSDWGGRYQWRAAAGIEQERQAFGDTLLSAIVAALGPSDEVIESPSVGRDRHVERLLAVLLDGWGVDVDYWVVDPNGNRTAKVKAEGYRKAALGPSEGERTDV